jgi:hypothetical protein
MTSRIARSGDKGNRATLSVIARDPAHYPLLERTADGERVQAHYRGVVHGPVDALPAAAAGCGALRAGAGAGRRRHAFAGAGRAWQDPEQRHPRHGELDNPGTDTPATR